VLTIKARYGILIMYQVGTEQDQHLTLGGYTMTTTKITQEQREKAMELLTDNGDLNIMPVEEFMTAYEPYQIARMVKMANLNLDCDYVRVNVYYSDTHEADDTYSLLSDDEIEDALDELQ